MSDLNLGSLLAAIREGRAPCAVCTQRPDHPWHVDPQSTVRCLGYEPVELPKVGA